MPLAIRVLALLLLLQSGIFAQYELVRKVDAENGIEVAVQVEDQAGESVFSFRSEQQMVLASNTKLFTTAAAMAELGSDYRWQTSLFLYQQRLYVVGGGDPSLRLAKGVDGGARMLDQVVAMLKDREISSLREVIFDDTFFARPVRHPDWPEDQWMNKWCAPVSALAVEGNCLLIESIDGQLKIIPPLGAALKVKRKTGKPGTPLSAWWSGNQFSIQVRGSQNTTGEVALAVSEPRDLFQHWFLEGLRSRGIPAASSSWRNESEPDAVGTRETFLLYRHPSAWTLAEAVAVANKDSDNFVSEVLFLTLARLYGEGGDFSTASVAVEASLHEAGWEFGARSQVDGSGLARDLGTPLNTASVKQVCALLRMMGESEQGAVWFDSLPVAGVEGRLKARFGNQVFQPGRVHAKTGWISGASALSGYLLAGDDDVLSFSIVVNYQPDGSPRTNNARFKALQEDILEQVLSKWAKN